MINLSVDHMDRLQSILAETPQKIPIVAARAINRAATSARTEAARKSRETYYIKHGDVIKTIRINNASPADLSASVISRGKLTPLYAFRVLPKNPAPRRKAPITAAVKKGSGGPMKTAFVASMHSGHKGVFKRTGTKRLPIEELYGPSIPQMIGSESVSRWVEEKAQEMLDKRLEHEITRALEGF